MNYVIKLGLTAFFTELLQIWYLGSYILSISIAIIINFFYNMHITFKVKGKKGKRFIWYVFFILIMMGVDVILVRFTTEILKLHYMLSIFIITSLLVIIKYIVFNKVIFAHGTKR